MLRSRADRRPQGRHRGARAFRSGQRWGRFFIIIDEELRAAAKISVGDMLTMVVGPTTSARALARARVQSKRTTAPKKGRPDAIDPD